MAEHDQVEVGNEVGALPLINNQSVERPSLQNEVAPEKTAEDYQAEPLFQQSLVLSKKLMGEGTPFNPALASLLYFTKMGELASKKGSSVFGSIAGAGVAPAAYLMQKEKEKAARDANVNKTAISLYTAASKDKKIGTPKTYEVKNVKNVTSLIGLINPATNKPWAIDDPIPLTPKQVSGMPTGSVLEAVKTDKPEIKEDEFGDFKFVSGPNKGELVFPTQAPAPVEAPVGAPVEAEVGAEVEAEVGAGPDPVPEGLVNGEPFVKEIITSPPLPTSTIPIPRLNKNDRSYSTKLRDDLSKQLKKLNDIERSYRNIKAFYKKKGAIGDYGLAVGFAKIIDPGSAAKEGEVRAVSTAGSIAAGFKEALLNALDGRGKMPPRLRSQIYNAALKLYNEEAERLAPVIASYKRLAESQLPQGAWPVVFPRGKFETDEAFVTVKGLEYPAPLKDLTTVKLQKMLQTAQEGDWTNDELDEIAAAIESRK
mgnify:FL=1